MENTVFSRQEIQNMDISVDKVHFVSSFDSLLTMMRERKYLVFSERCFGAFSGMEGLGFEPLSIESRLCACVPSPLESRDAERLLTYMKENLI